ncbi:MAG TPA: transcription termination/antitermination protein NusG [Actinomycetota bacterium]|jgi:transcriptional antiterminator NusG
MNDSGVTVDESAPADQPQDETEKPEFPGFREGEDDGPMPEAGGSVETPEEDAELEAARVDEEVETDTPTTDTDLADSVESGADVVDAYKGQEDVAVVIENDDRTDTALEDERPDEETATEDSTADTSETVPETPAEDPAASDVLDAAPAEVADQSLSEAAPIGAEESEGEFGTGAPVEDATAEAAAPAAAAPAAAAEAAPASDETPAESDEEATGRANPFRGPGEWYVVHTYAGYENKVKTNLESRIHTMQMEEKIFDVHIPMEDVMEIKGGKKQVVQRKVFPGYLLVKMVYDNDSWYVVRNTPGVTGFVSAGTGTKPTPLSRREVEKILAVKKEEVKPQFRLEFEEQDVVRIISGPFADFNGTISEINLDQSKLKVLVNIFDRETPVELGFDQVQKV